MHYLRYYLLTTLMLGIAGVVYCQQQVSGTVIDGITRKPLPFAGVRLVNADNSVLADENGVFTLPLQSPNLADTALFSYIGYEDMHMPVSEAVNQSVFPLPVSYVEIEAVVVTPLSAEEIIHLADSLHEVNHRMTNTVQQGFYREVITVNQEHFKVSEAAFKRYQTADKELYKVDKARSITDSLGLKTIKQVFDFKKNSFSLTIENLIGMGMMASASITEEKKVTKKMGKHEKRTQTTYLLNGYSTYLGREVYDISATTTYKKKPFVESRILIDRESFAYASFEALLHKEANTAQFIPFAARALLKLLGYSIAINGMEFRMYFKPYNDKWLYDKGYVKLLPAVAKKQNWVYGHIHQEYYFSGISTSDDTFAEQDEKITEDKVNQFDAAYWQGYFHLPPSAQMNTHITAIQTRNSAFEGNTAGPKRNKWLTKQERKKKKLQQ